MITEEKERIEFLQVYIDFDKWLFKFGFEPDRSYHSTPLDCEYSWYKEKINSLYSVEHYINERLKISLRFLRDRNEHKFMIVGEMGCSSELLSINEFKELIKNEVVASIKAERNKLDYFNWLEK